MTEQRATGGLADHVDFGLGVLAYWAMAAATGFFAATTLVTIATVYPPDVWSVALYAVCTSVTGFIATVTALDIAALGTE